MPDKKPQLTKEERRRRIAAIAREYELKKNELGLKAPAIRRGPAFYLVVIIAFALIGGTLLQTAGRSGGKKTENVRVIMARKSLNALAEALGRYRFHVGKYPGIADGGLDALARKNSPYKGWIGPYCSKIVNDPWKRPYYYDDNGTNAMPVLLSLGPDGVKDTIDDVLPNVELFEKPFHDTTWTNDWSPYWLRGYILMSAEEKAAYLKKRAAERGEAQVKEK